MLITMITRQVWGYCVICSDSALTQGFETLAQAKQYQANLLKEIIQ